MKRKVGIGAVAFIAVLLVSSSLSFVVASSSWFYSETQQSTIVAGGTEYSISFDPMPSKMEYGDTYGFTGEVKKDGVPMVGITVNLIANDTMIYAYSSTDCNGAFDILYTINEPIGTVYNWKIGIEI